MKARIPDGVRLAVLFRDGLQCLAPILDPEAGPCHDKFGREVPGTTLGALTEDHVGEMRMGKAAKSDVDHLVPLCWGHHLGTGEKAGHCWATSHRPMLRDYLARKVPAVYGSDQLTTVELSWAAFHEAQAQDAGL